MPFFAGASMYEITDALAELGFRPSAMAHDALLEHEDIVMIRHSSSGMKPVACRILGVSNVIFTYRNQVHPEQCVDVEVDPGQLGSLGERQLRRMSAYPRNLEDELRKRYSC